MAVKKKEAVATYSKEQFLESKKYVDQRDMLHVLLKEKETYSIAQVNTMIEKFKKGKVK